MRERQDTRGGFRYINLEHEAQIYHLLWSSHPTEWCQTKVPGVSRETPGTHLRKRLLSGHAVSTRKLDGRLMEEPEVVNLSMTIAPRQIDTMNIIQFESAKASSLATTLHLVLVRIALGHQELTAPLKQRGSILK